MGELHTNLQKEDLVLKSNRNHFWDSEKVEVEKTLCFMKEQLKSGLSKPLEVYAEGLSKLDGNIRSKMLVEDHVKRSLRNQRSKLNPIEPTSLDNLIIDGTYLNYINYYYLLILLLYLKFNIYVQQMSGALQVILNMKIF